MDSVKKLSRSEGGFVGAEEAPPPAAEVERYNYLKKMAAHSQ